MLLSSGMDARCVCNYRDCSVFNVLFSAVLGMLVKDFGSLCRPPCNDNYIDRDVEYKTGNRKAVT